MNDPRFTPPAYGYTPPPASYAQPGYAGPPQAAAYPPGTSMVPVALVVQRTASSALVWSIVGFFILGIILGPVGILRGARALQLIAQYNVGYEHKAKAQVAVGIGILVTALWFVAVLAHLLRYAFS